MLPPTAALSRFVTAIDNHATITITIPNGFTDFFPGHFQLIGLRSLPLSIFLSFERKNKLIENNWKMCVYTLNSYALKSLNDSHTYSTNRIVLTQFLRRFPFTTEYWNVMYMIWYTVHAWKLRLILDRVGETVMMAAAAAVVTMTVNEQLWWILHTMIFTR